MDPQFRLEKGSKKHPCPGPGCGRKSFHRYIDTRTGVALPPQYGRCDHENKCGYHLNPYRDGYADRIREQERGSHTGNQVTPPRPKQPAPIPRQVSFVSQEAVNGSLKRYNENNLIIYLLSLFGVEVVRELLSTYPVGTSKHWPGASVFWQMDIDGRFRDGKIMLFDASTGKRIKEPFSHVTWYHKAVSEPDFNLQQCFFGEHLLQDKRRPVAIVEAEKTALVASVYLPELIWLAAGSEDGLSREKCQVLKGRNVILYPDLSRDGRAFSKWSQNAEELSDIATFTVSDYLERIATPEDREKGKDLEDFLPQYDYRDFIRPASTQLQEVKEQAAQPAQTDRADLTETHQTIPAQPGTPRPQPWDKDIKELTEFFYDGGRRFTGERVQLSPCSTITDIPLFTQSHLEVVKARNGNQTFLPYLERMQALMLYLKARAT